MAWQIWVFLCVVAVFFGIFAYAGYVGSGSWFPMLVVCLGCLAGYGLGSLAAFLRDALPLILKG